MKIGRKLRILRIKKGWSNVAPVARLCGVSPRTVENWEQDRTHISGPALQILREEFEKMGVK